MNYKSLKELVEEKTGLGELFHQRTTEYWSGEIPPYLDRVNDAFNWQDTDEGYIFWLEVSEKCGQ